MTQQLTFDAKRTAILRVHPQKAIVGADGAFASKFRAEVERADLIPTVTRFVGTARSKGVKILFCRGTFSPGYPELVPNVPILRQVAEYGVLVNGSPGAELVDELTPQEGDYVFISLPGRS